MNVYLWGAVAAMNLLAFAMFGIDKWKASREKRRVREARLLWLAFLTGLFGAWMGISFFHHKTRKTSFRVKLVLVTLINPLWLLIYWRYFAQ